MQQPVATMQCGGLERERLATQRPSLTITKLRRTATCRPRLPSTSLFVEQNDDEGHKDEPVCDQPGVQWLVNRPGAICYGLYAMGYML